MAPRPATDLQRLLAEEPFVRSLARSLAADSDDIVQQTWLAALENGRDVARPRSWLRRVVRHAAANLRRGDRRRAERERAVAAHDLAPSSVELMEREERRRALVTAVDRLPPPMRTVVLLRYFEGLPPRRIASDLGVPVTTVWTQLRRGLALLRRRLDPERGEDRRARLLPPLWWTGVIAMTTKIKIVAAAAVSLAVAGAFVFWPGDDGSPGWSRAGGDGAPAAGMRADLPRAVGPDAADADASRREVVAAPIAAGPPTTGSLVVRVRYGDDGQPAPGVTMIVRRPGADFRVDSLRAETDDAGVATFTELPPRRYYVHSDRGSAGERADLLAGETTELDYELEVGLTVTGIVVDGSGTPVPGATIEVAPLARADFDAQALATAGADGRFSVRGASPFCLIGARAAGFAASPLRFLVGEDGNHAEVRIELAKAGGVVEGIVVRTDGSPVPRAVVIVGSGNTSAIVASAQGAPPLPALVRSDAEGRFRAIGVRPGVQPAVARAAGLPPWRGTCDVVSHGTSALRITLAEGATLRGIVRGADGSPVPGAEVNVGSYRDFAQYRARTAADGTFELTGLPQGDVEVHAAHDERGKATTRVHTTAGATAACELSLSRGLELRGRVLDEAGEPVEGLILEVLGQPSAGGEWWASHERTDGDGRFAVANCPAGTRLTVEARGRDIETLRRTGVDPEAGPLELRVRRTLPPSARIAGRIVGPGGEPVSGAMVGAYAQERLDSPGLRSTDDDGRFELGPLVPGTWRVRIRGTAYPGHTTEPRRLDADATWNLGEVRLIQGGTAVVNVLGGEPDGLVVRVVDAAETLTEVPQGDGPLRTGPLAPGDYRLLVSGKDTAAQSSPFSIRAGEQTKLDVRLQPGTPQRLELAVPGGSRPDASIAVRVLRDDELVLRTWVSARGDAPLAADVRLAPGSYRVTAVAGDLRGSAELEVGRDPARAVRIALR